MVMQVGGLENKCSMDLGLMQVWSRLDGSPRLMDSPWWLLYPMYIWVCSLSSLYTFCLWLVVDSLSLLALLARSVLVLGGLATLYASFVVSILSWLLLAQGVCFVQFPSYLCSLCSLGLVANSSISFVSSSYIGSCYWVPLDFSRNIFCLDMI